MDLPTLVNAAVAMSQERSLEAVLDQSITGLSKSDGVALARIWLLATDQGCGICRAHPETPDRPSLHLVASAGRPFSLQYRNEDWSRRNGEFHKISLGRGKVGTIGSSAEPILIKRIEDDYKWILKPEWARTEGLRSFAGHPLIFRNEIVGVVAVFSHDPLDENEFEWLRVFGAALAAAICNSRDFDRLEIYQKRLDSENTYLREEVAAISGATRLLGDSEAIRRVVERIEMVAATDATVLILGETGVGKELVARAVHERSKRHDRPLIKVNCTAVARDLFESEFFGHVRGAFSGAIKDRIGRFQLAAGGSLFLDEVGDLPQQMQPKLLRVLQEGEFEAVGDDRTRRSDARIIAATNHDLENMVKTGRFRRDLYYRLNLFPIEVPPLRDRKEDIPLLSRHFFDAACKRYQRANLKLTEGRIEQLRNYDWPGNVRELQYVIERAVIAARSGSLQFDVPRGSALSPSADTAPNSGLEEGERVLSEKEMQQRERENIATALKRCNFKIYGAGGAAELLSMKPTTLSARIKKLGLKGMP
jgi:transcriptional regulator with GAF, ATPase, and Fis domain